MIEALTFTNRFGRSLRCVLSAPERSHFAITSVEGLGPGEASVNIHDVVTADGGFFGSARFGSRNIVVNFRFLEFDADGNYMPIEMTRHLSYEFFQPKSKIQILIETTGRKLYIEGYIESNEPEIFSDEESMSVSILCPGYYFKMVSGFDYREETFIYGSGMFQFPFSNESLTDKLIKFGEYGQDEYYDLYYDGDSENGFELTIYFRGEPVTNTITISNRPLGNPSNNAVGFLPTDDHPSELSWVDNSIAQSYIRIDLTALASRISSLYSDPIYTVGNKIVICTRPGEKSAKFVLSNNTEINILGYIAHLEWMKLYPGYNRFEVIENNASAGHFSVSAMFESLYSGV